MDAASRPEFRYWIYNLFRGGKWHRKQAPPQRLILAIVATLLVVAQVIAGVADGAIFGRHTPGSSLRFSLR
jgi:hypothetical protein